jgi:hypothetical protein
MAAAEEVLGGAAPQLERKVRFRRFRGFQVDRSGLETATGSRERVGELDA